MFKKNFAQASFTQLSISYALAFALVGCNQEFGIQLSPMNQLSGKNTIGAAPVASPLPGSPTQGPIQPSSPIASGPFKPLDPNPTPSSSPDPMVSGPYKPLDPNPTPSSFPSPGVSSQPSSSQPSAPVTPAVSPTPSSSPSPAVSPSPTVSPSPSSTPVVNRCLSPVNTSLIGLSDAAIRLNGNPSVFGNSIIYGSSSAMRLNGNASLNGKAYSSSVEQVQTIGNAYVQEIVTSAPPIAEASIVDLAHDLAEMNPSTVHNGIQASADQDILFQGNSASGGNGINVIKINGDLLLSGNSRIRLEGSSSDVFIFNIVGNMSLVGNSIVELGHGIQAKNIVFNVIHPDGGSISVRGNASASGTLLASSGKIDLSGNSDMQGVAIAKSGIQLNGRINIQPVQFCIHQ